MIELGNGIIVSVSAINYIEPCKDGRWDIMFSDRVLRITKEDYEKIKEYCKLQDDLVNAACKAII